jgi:TolB-like protein
MAKVRFLRELRRRHVFRVAAGYAVVGWLLIQIATQVFPFFDLPNWSVRLIVLIVLVGFPIALVLAWAFDATRQGIVRTPDAHDIAPYRSQRAGIVVGLIGILFAVVAGIGYLHWHGEQATKSAIVDTTTASDKSIAVLPLFGGVDPKDDYLGDGISEEVLNALSKLPGLHVIGRASSFQFRGNNVDAGKVGRALNVRNLLSGTVQRAGDELRISVELIDTATGLQTWSQRYDRTFKNLFALEDDISGAVSKALAVRLGAAADQPLVDVATTSPHAHELYLRAKQLAYLSDEASLNQSVALFNQAIAVDPNYAAAWAGLARTYAFLSDAYRAPIELAPAMRSAAEKAVALDPYLADGHVYLSYVLMADEHNFPAARHESERAVALNPGSADAHMFLGLILLQANHDYTAARVELRNAEKIDPLNMWNIYTEIWAATAQGDFAGVLELAQRINQIDPRFFYLSDPLVYAYASSGRWRECVDRSIATQTNAGDLPDFAAAICYVHDGNPARAREILQQLENAAHTRYIDSSDIAAIYAALGDNERALAALEQAYQDRSQPLLNIWFLPWFKPLRDDPRYQALVDKINGGHKASVSP